MKKIEKTKKTLLYFAGEECVQCRHFEPLVYGKSQALNMEFVKVECEKEPELVAKYGIRGVPQVIILDGEEIIKRGHASDILKEL